MALQDMAHSILEHELSEDFERVSEGEAVRGEAVRGVSCGGLIVRDLGGKVRVRWEGVSSEGCG